jgi:hypothetical protein
MTIPSSNISLSNDIYGEANGGYSSGEVSLNDVSFYSYFAGPNGSNSISYNAWGAGENSGLNRIYGTTVHTGTAYNWKMSEYSGLTYFYDNSTYQVTLEATNNLPAPTIPPDPPDLYDVNVNVELWGEGFSYQYIAGGGQVTSNGGTYGPSSISQTDDPIIFRGYWKVVISGVNPMFAGCNADLSINGTSKFSGQAVSGGPGGTTFDSVTWGTQDVASSGGFIGLYFTVITS